MHIWNTLIYIPFYNALIGLVSFLPFHDLGFAVVLLTVIVRLVLYPLSKKSIESQIKMRLLEPELTALKKQYPAKQEQTTKTFELYKKYKINPFSGCLPLLIQLPIIIGLYTVFRKGIPPDAALYSFVQMPESINTVFLGVLPLDSKSIILAVFVALSQYVQAKIVTPPAPQVSNDDHSFQSQMAKSMRIQMLYVLPIIMAFFAYQVSAAIGLYLLISNLFSIGQEIYVRRRMKNFVLVPQV